ncbi:MAG: hypothetical protein WBE26_02885, partial [Phycisphaerae bacterium]
MVESTLHGDVLLAADSAIDAFERELNEYQTQLGAWSNGLRTQLESQRVAENERAAARARDLDEREKELADVAEQLAQQERIAAEREEATRAEIADQHQALLDAQAVLAADREELSAERDRLKEEENALYVR